MQTRRFGGASLAIVTIVCSVVLVSSVFGQADFSVYRSLGDSLTHGTQGGKVVDYRTQDQAYPVLLAKKMNTAFPLAYIEQSVGNDVQTQVGAPNFVYGANLAVNGAKLSHALYREAQPLDPAKNYLSGQMCDVVLAPRAGTVANPVHGVTQVSAALADNATFTTVWLGGNDFLNTLTKYGTILNQFLSGMGIDYPVDPLTVTDITDQASFAADYHELMNRMMSKPGGMKMAIANFPELRDIAGVLDKQELTALIGPNPMPDDAYTNILTAAAIMYDDVSYWGQDIWNASMLTNPANYWDASEVAAINAAINGFNSTIVVEAAENDVALVDLRTVFRDVAENSLWVGDWEINADIFIANLGQKKASLFSSDGCHPSDVGHALVANAFIDAINSHYGTSLERYSQAELRAILDADKFADNDMDGRIEGVSSDFVPWLSINTFTPTYTGDAPEVVPEPATLAVLLLGTVGGLMRRRMS